MHANGLCLVPTGTAQCASRTRPAPATSAPGCAAPAAAPAPSEAAAHTKHPHAAARVGAWEPTWLLHRLPMLLLSPSGADAPGGSATDETGHPASPVGFCRAVSRPLSLPQRRRCHTPCAREHTQVRCAADVSSRAGSWSEQPCPQHGGRRQQGSDHSRLHGAKHTRYAHGVPDLSLARRWHVPGMLPDAGVWYTLAIRVTPQPCTRRWC
jgi:hypothetical protein